MIEAYARIHNKRENSNQLLQNLDKTEYQSIYTGCICNSYSWCNLKSHKFHEHCCQKKQWDRGFTQIKISRKSSANNKWVFICQVFNDTGLSDLQ